jgi:23S rRNA (uracil1939-C5)-methyltransferase
VSRQRPSPPLSPLSIEVSSLGEHGEGVALWSERPLFVAGALPGEQVLVEIEVEKPTYRVGRLLSIQQRSPQRRTPPCPVFGRCGGCQLQHMEESGQLEWKREKVRQALLHHQLEAPVEPVIASPTHWHYRCKMLMPVDGCRLGLYALHSHQLVPIPHCQVHHPHGEQVRAAVQRWLENEGPIPFLRHVLMRTSHLTGKVLLAFVVSEHQPGVWSRAAHAIAADCPHLQGVVCNLQPEQSNVILGRSTELIWGRAQIEEELCGIPATLSATSFFQINPPQAEAIGRKILAWAAQWPTARLLDGYCGAGAMALALSRAGHDVTGIEVVPSAIDDARKTAQHLGLPARFECARMEEWLPRHAQAWEGILLNPPRKGCDPRVIAAVLEAAPQSICMVSCEPRTCARDLAVLSRDYEIEQVQPFDLFPQTVHVETLVTLRRRGS